MFFKCQSLSKLADIFLSNEEFLFKQIDTFREMCIRDRPLLEVGADVLVAGSFVFRSPDPLKTIRELKEL